MMEQQRFEPPTYTNQFWLGVQNLLNYNEKYESQNV